MISLLIHSLPMSLLFMTLSDQWTLDGFILGFVVGLVTLLLIGDRRDPVNIVRLPGRLLWFVRYVVGLAWAILLSGLDVARRVLDPRLPVQPGEFTISTQDKSRDVLLSALSAHAITVTPGEMVEDFEEGDGETLMVIHTLDIDATTANAEREQTNRITTLKRIARKDDN